MCGFCTCFVELGFEGGGKKARCWRYGGCRKSSKAFASGIAIKWDGMGPFGNFASVLCVSALIRCVVADFQWVLTILK